MIHFIQKLFMKNTFSLSVKSIALNYVLIFSVLALIAVGNYYLISQQTKRSQFDASLINIGGRQRLLLEQTALLTQSLVVESDPTKRTNLKKELIDTVQLMEDSHNGLIFGNPKMNLPGILSPELEALYFDSLLPVDTQIKNYVKAVQAILTLKDDEIHSQNIHVNYIQSTIAKRELLTTLNAIVDEYQKSSEANTNRLNILAIGILVFSLFVLASASWFIIRPTVKRLQGEVVELAEAEKSLEEKIEKRTRELNISQSRFSGIVEIAEDAIISIDQSKKIILFNQGAEAIFGYSHDEVIGKSLDILLPQSSRKMHSHHIDDFSKSGISSRKMGSRSEIKALHKNGQEFLAEASISQLELGGEKLFTVMLRDITDLKRDEEELRAAKENAEEANQAKTQFLANMSHEIRTPLNSIVGFSQILINRSKPLSLPNDFREYLENIKLSGENLSELINNILDLSKIEAGKMGVSEEALNLKLLVQGIYHINKAQALQKGILFTYDFDPNLPTIINGDRTKLNQILMNLVSNGIKFTPAKKEVRLIAKRENHLIWFQVVDRGIGISEEHQKTIFETFHQIDNSTTRFFAGSGLGLAITKKMVETIGGVIEVESTMEKGSTFTVKIPLVEASTEVESTDFGFNQFHFSKDNSVMVVEDNPYNQKMMKALFIDLGLDIEIAEDGRTGIEKALKLKPDLVLMDIHMPGMDGMEATQQIRKHPDGKDIPIVALSADAFTQQEKAAYDAGISDYLTKPLDIRKLIPVLVKYLRQDHDETPITLENQEPLTKSVEAKLLAEFKALAEIPPFLSNDIIQQVKKMTELCNGYQAAHYSQLLKKIENAVFSRNSKQIPTLIDEVLNG